MMILNQVVRAFTRKGCNTNSTTDPRSTNTNSSISKLLLRTITFRRQETTATYTGFTDMIDKANDDDNVTTSSRSIHLDTSLLFDLDNAICSYDYESDDDSDDKSDSDSDSDDSSFIFAPPPVQFVCVPLDFSHVDALLSLTIVQDSSSNNNINRNFLLNRRDWDNHTIETNNPDDDVTTRIII